MFCSILMALRAIYFQAILLTDPVLLLLCMYSCLYLTDFPCARLYYYTQYCHYTHQHCKLGKYHVCPLDYLMQIPQVAGKSIFSVKSLLKDFPLVGLKLTSFLCLSLTLIFRWYLLIGLKKTNLQCPTLTLISRGKSVLVAVAGVPCIAVNGHN